jgi:ABC-2 type transport system ATP-binding protein
MTNVHSEFWSKVAARYDEVVDLQIGATTRSRVRDRLLSESRLGKLAEFGCGTGFYTEALVNKATAVVATDLSPGMLAVAKQKVTARNVTFQLEDCQKTSFPSEAFDSAFMSLVIHFTDPATTLAEMHRILKPGGTLIISNGDPKMLSTGNRFRWLARGIFYGITRHRVKPPKGFSKNVVTEKELCNLLVKTGFKVVNAESFRDESSSANLPVEYIKAVKV